jgi:phosphoglycolate phosphatase-like HAD superfamily hydrolase
MKTEALVFDLDDTLIDTKIRHYKLMSDHVQKSGHRFISYADYLGLRKSNSLPNAEILKRYYPDTLVDFNAFWLTNIESFDYLKYDFEIVCSELLKEVKKIRSCSLVLLSLRSQIEAAENQFQKFSFARLFDNVCFVKHHAVNPKIEILNEIKRGHEKTRFFGDAESDATAAVAAGVDFFGVTTGFYPLSHPCKEATINHILLNLYHD